MNVTLAWRWVRGQLPRWGQENGYVTAIYGETYRDYMNYRRAVGGKTMYATCPDHWIFYGYGFEEPMLGLRR